MKGDQGRWKAKGMENGEVAGKMEERKRMGEGGLEDSKKKENGERGLGRW